MRRAMAAVRTVEAPGARIRTRTRTSTAVLRSLDQRLPPRITRGLTLNTSELAGLLGFPYGTVVAPGLNVGSSTQLPPRYEVPEDGDDVVELGVSTYPGLTERRIGLRTTDRLQHLHVMGPTGVGKSTLLGRMLLQDASAGRGLVLLDPKGDLVSDVLARTPVHRHDDVIILDPTDPARPVGFNPLWVQSAERHVIDRAVDFVVGTLHSLYERTWGPRTEDTLRAACLTLVLASDPDRPYTLCDVTELLIGDKKFRASIVERVEDDDLLLFWAWFEHLPQNDKLNMLGPVLNKLRAFTLRVAIRGVIGQPKGLDLNEVLRSGKLLLVPLPKGVLGQEIAALIGSLLVSSLWQATLERAALPGDERPFVSLVIDEVQEFLRLPGDIGDVLAEARGLGVGMTLAHQHLGQLDKELQAAVLANARSKVYFQLNHADAASIAPLMGGWLQAQDLENLPVREVVVVPTVDSQVLPPCTARTLPLPPLPTVDVASDLRRASALRFGTAIEDLRRERPLPQVMAEPRRRRPSKPSGPTRAAGSGRAKRAPISGSEP